ncbi:EPL1 domain containing protein [Trichuris trichiura]|uniref:EPL1 domain containing protein n=1 Tax=Trichuris trichiura TaxID=36087 RepID=A0A077Z8V6_TRITR|nr:EPL1 domain containing protein [Trichuris trichiura]
MHLQQVISARQSISKPVQAFDVSIPIPRVETERNRYEALYRTDFVQPKRFVAAQSSNTDILDYDMDSDDEAWFQTFVKKFEVKQSEARALFNGPSDFVDELYRYWLNKRVADNCSFCFLLGITLIPQVLTDNRDASPMAYIAFRRRKEKIATRKWRKTEQDTVIRGMVTAQSIDIASTYGIVMLFLTSCRSSCYCINDRVKCANDVARKRLLCSKLIWTNQWQQQRPSSLREGKLKVLYGLQKTIRYCIGRLPPSGFVDQVDISNPDGRFTFRRRKNCNYYLVRIPLKQKS